MEGVVEILCDYCGAVTTYWSEKLRAYVCIECRKYYESR